MDIQLDEERKIYSVSQLMQSVRWQLESSFGSVWVEGEISSFSQYPSGHMYFSVKDKDAVLPCVMFRRDNSKLKFEPEAGMSVLIHGTMSVYAPRGQSQFIVNLMDPKGLGQLQLAFEQIKKKLEKEGLFDQSRKRPVPFMPRKIGVVTSQAGAVWHDIQNVLSRRFPDSHLVLAATAVQGEAAKESIVRAIADLNTLGDIDVIIVARGGGSLEDLWAFNEECVARAIDQSEAPVISAIGHEVDYTIADFVADLRAPTPSAAAELVMPEYQQLHKSLSNIDLRLKRGLKQQLTDAEEHVMKLLKSRAFKEPLSMLNEKSQKVDDLYLGLEKKLTKLVETKYEKMTATIACLNVLNPLNCLERGYSVVFDERKDRIIKSSNQLSPKDRISIRMKDGFVRADVLDIDYID